MNNERFNVITKNGHPVSRMTVKPMLLTLALLADYNIL